MNQTIVVDMLLRCKIVVAKNVGDFEVGVSGAGVDNGEN
jgi:hypothetical protein